jgi:hypothetical protein
MNEHMTKKDAVAAAMSIAEDVTEGKLDPADLQQQVIIACRELVGQVIGEGDDLFPLQTEIARSVLAVGGGIGPDELAEYLALARRRQDTGPA